MGGEDRRPGGTGDLGRAIGAVGVHDEELVDHGDGPAHEVAADRAHDGADGGFLVAGRDDHRNPP